MTLEANSWDEPGAAEVRDGPLVSLAKMILITSRLIITNKSLKKVTVKWFGWHGLFLEGVYKIELDTKPEYEGF